MLSSPRLSLRSTSGRMVRARHHKNQLFSARMNVQNTRARVQPIRAENRTKLSGIALIDERVMYK